MRRESGCWRNRKICRFFFSLSFLMTRRKPCGSLYLIFMFICIQFDWLFEIIIPTLSNRDRKMKLMNNPGCPSPICQSQSSNFSDSRTKCNMSLMNDATTTGAVTRSVAGRSPIRSPYFITIRRPFIVFCWFHYILEKLTDFLSLEFQKLWHTLISAFSTSLLPQCQVLDVQTC